MTASPRVDYVASARRHLKDAAILKAAGRQANAGQLFGFSVECALKATLVATGAAVDPDGNLLGKKQGGAWREHMPRLGQLVMAATVLPDGRSASLLNGHLHHLPTLATWHTDHRYFRTSAIPLATSLQGWEAAARNTDALLDDMKAQGLLP